MTTKSSAAQWVGSMPKVAAWAFKKDMPEHLRREAYRIDFGLFGLAYVARDESGSILLKDGTRATTLDFWLNTPGHVIGLKDMQAAAHRDWAFEWQQACADRMMEAVTLHAAVGGSH